MPGAARRRNRGVVEFWPGFVDALATLLIVIIFLLLVFVLSQFFLNQAITGKDEALQRLNSQIAQLADLLAMEKTTNAELRLNIGQLSSELQASANARDEALARVAGVMSERDALAVKLNQVTAQLADAKDKADQAGAETQKARRDLEDAVKSVEADKEKLTVQLKELEQLRRDVEALRTVRGELEKQVAGLATTIEARDKDLTAARDNSKELETKLSSQEERTALAQKDVAQRDIRLAELLAQAENTKGEITREKQLSADSVKQVDLLNQQIAALRQQLATISEALQLSETKTKAQDIQIVDLGKRLNARAGQQGRGAGALPLRILRPAAPSAGRPARRAHRRRPLRVPIRGAVRHRLGRSGRPGQAAARQARRHLARPDGPHAQGHQLGAAGRRPIPTGCRSTTPSSRRTGSSRRRARSRSSSS
ncbi:MAG: hypothetical protein WDO24_01820 [Pseudomonadota bacterium]